MTDDATDLVRRFYDAWNQYGPDVLDRYAAPEVELRDAPELPDSGRWRGRDAVRRRLEEVAEHVGGGWVEVHEVRAYGSRVLVRMRWKLDARVKGADVGDVFHVVGIQGGRVTSIDVFLRESEALDAAGR
jgi:ketosteroid isomerase-like protein